MAEIKTICVYCGSSPGRDGSFIDAATNFGKILGKEKIGLVFGGGGVGLMGAVARAARDAGAEVTGIIPEFLVNRERPEAAHSTRTIVTKDMHERKHKMFELADAFVALPGGIGTLEELVEQLTWIQLGQHQKPLLVLNINGFWRSAARAAHEFPRSRLCRATCDRQSARRRPGRGHIAEAAKCSRSGHALDASQERDGQREYVTPTASRT